MKNKIIIFLSLVFLLISPFQSKGAVLSLEPSKKTFGPGSVFEMKIMVDLEKGECINAAQLMIDFPENGLDVIDVNTGDSFFSLWIETPRKNDLEKINRTGKISFIGGVPGGWCGSGEFSYEEEYEPRPTKAASIIFTVEKGTDSSQANIGFSSLSQAFLNSSLGIPTELKYINSYLEIDKDFKETEDEWAKKILEDKNPPEPFTIDISQSDILFAGNYFAVFSTIDKETGIDYYEISEIPASQAVQIEKANTFIGKAERIISRNEIPEIRWERAETPYLLKDQSLTSVIMVKAVDKAGNEKIIKMENGLVRAAFYKKATMQTVLIIVLIISFIIISLSIIIYLIARWRCNKNKSK